MHNNSYQRLLLSNKVHKLEKATQPIVLFLAAASLALAMLFFLGPHYQFDDRKERENPKICLGGKVLNLSSPYAVPLPHG